MSCLTINRPSTCRDATWHFGGAFWFRSAVSILNFGRPAMMLIFVGVFWPMVIGLASRLRPWYGIIVDRPFMHTIVSKKGTGAQRDCWLLNIRNDLWRLANFGSMGSFMATARLGCHWCQPGFITAGLGLHCSKLFTSLRNSVSLPPRHRSIGTY